MAEGKKILVADDDADLRDILRSIFNHITDQAVVMPLYYDANVEMISNRTVNVSPGYMGNAHLWDKR
jgi:hypothetical protein